MYKLALNIQKEKFATCNPAQDSYYINYNYTSYKRLIITITIIHFNIYIKIKNAITKPFYRKAAAQLSISIIQNSIILSSFVF